MKYFAIFQGTPNWRIERFGSPVITERAEKSTRFPSKLPRIRPDFEFSRFTEMVALTSGGTSIDRQILQGKMSDHPSLLQKIKKFPENILHHLLTKFDPVPVIVICYIEV